MSLWQDPVCVDDFPLSFESRRELLKFVAGVTQIPDHGKNGILLHGPFGSGKTTLANLLPRWIEYGKAHPGELTKDTAGLCEGYPVEDFDKDVKVCGQGMRGPELVDFIKSYGRCLGITTQSRFRYLILDEIDNLTDPAQKTLKGEMNQTKQLIYLMTTNNLNKVDGGIKSRCHILNIGSAPLDSWLALIQRAYDRAGKVIEFNDYVRRGVAGCNGDARDTRAWIQKYQDDIDFG